MNIRGGDGTKKALFGIKQSSSVRIQTIQDVNQKYKNSALNSIKPIFTQIKNVHTKKTFISRSRWIQKIHKNYFWTWPRLLEVLAPHKAHRILTSFVSIRSKLQFQQPVHCWQIVSWFVPPVPRCFLMQHYYINLLTSIPLQINNKLF